MKKPDDIKFALECASGIPMPCNSCPYKNAADHNCGVESSADALDYIEQLEAKVPKWISVEERLPEKYTPVVIAYKDSWGDMDSATGVISDRETWFGCGISIDPKSVTHWMPLPEPPEV